jgi:hypothetical protein
MKVLTRTDPAAQRTACAPAPSGLRYERLPLIGLSLLALLAALWAGLVRLGWNLPNLQPGLYAAHGPLMVCGFLGTLISLERAVAVGESWSYAAPILSGAGALALIIGVPDPIGPLLITCGSFSLILTFVAILRRQTALFTITMALGAVAWLAGNCMWLAGIPIAEMFFWWTGFLVLTIAGERLELSRLTGAGERHRTSFALGAGIFLVGLATAFQLPRIGLRVAGLGMLAIAIWLWRYDLARRTIKQSGLTRFIAANLLAGYFWLGLGAVFWIWFGSDLTTFHYDAMLHTVFLGFVFSMIFAHAPVIFPALLQRPLPYRSRFYAHSALLHLSLLLRICGDLTASFPLFDWGAFLNVLAVLLFLASTVQAVASEIVQARRHAAEAPARSGVQITLKPRARL